MARPFCAWMHDRVGGYSTEHRTRPIPISSGSAFTSLHRRVIRVFGSTFDNCTLLNFRTPCRRLQVAERFQGHWRCSEASVRARSTAVDARKLGMLRGACRDRAGHACCFCCVAFAQCRDMCGWPSAFVPQGGTTAGQAGFLPKGSPPPATVARGPPHPCGHGSC